MRSKNFSVYLTLTEIFILFFYVRKSHHHIFQKTKLGKVKTRIATSLGDSTALEIYKELLEITFKILHPMKCTKYLFGMNCQMNLPVI